MSQEKLYGYYGKILRVDLSKSEIKPENSDESALKNYVGEPSLPWRRAVKRHTDKRLREHRRRQQRGHDRRHGQHPGERLLRGIPAV
jgi:hypothetical protein